MKPFPLAIALSVLPVAAMAEGMPQMDFHNPLLLSQVYWGVGIFLALYLLASRVALPKVGEVLEERASKIKNDLEAAQASKAKADADAAASMAAIAAARSEAQTAINAALAASNAGSGQASWVYAVAYGASNTGCQYDTSPTISPCDTMRGIASKNGVADATKFYSDNSTGTCQSSAHPTITDLNGIFTAIARDLQNSSLLE